MTCISILLLFSLIREELEADGHQGDICGWGLHKKTTQIRKIYPTYGTWQLDIVEERISMMQVDSNKSSYWPCAQREEKSVHDFIFYSGSTVQEGSRDTPGGR